MTSEEDDDDLMPEREDPNEEESKVSGVAGADNDIDAMINEELRMSGN